MTCLIISICLSFVQLLFFLASCDLSSPFRSTTVRAFEAKWLRTRAFDASCAQLEHKCVSALTSDPFVGFPSRVWRPSWRRRGGSTSHPPERRSVGPSKVFEQVFHGLKRRSNKYQ